LPVVALGSVEVAADTTGVPRCRGQTCVAGQAPAPPLRGQATRGACPELTSDARHGSWTFAVDLPSLTGKRATRRRGGYPTRKAATAALTRVLDCERSGIWLDDRQTVADYLATWLAEKSRTLKPTTAAVYTGYVMKDLVPAFGAVRLEKLNHLHVARFIDEQLAAGRTCQEDRDYVGGSCCCESPPPDWSPPAPTSGTP
jgi:hypothetical protein